MSVGVPYYVCTNLLACGTMFSDSALLPHLRILHIDVQAIKIMRLIARVQNTNQVALLYTSNC